MSDRYPDTPASYLEAIGRWDPTGVVLCGINLGPRAVVGRRYDLVDALVAVNDARFTTHLDAIPPVDELLEVGSIGADPVLVAMAGAKEHQPGAVYRCSPERPDEPAEVIAPSFGEVLTLATRADDLLCDAAELRITERAARARLDLMLDAQVDPETRLWWRRHVLHDLEAVADAHREPW